MVHAGIGPASLEELVALKGALPKDSLPVVDVRTLLYRGQQALKRAEELRAAAQHASGDSLRPLVDDVRDPEGPERIARGVRSEEHTSELQPHSKLLCGRLLASKRTRQMRSTLANLR